MARGHTRFRLRGFGTLDAAFRAVLVAASLAGCSPDPSTPVQAGTAALEERQSEFLAALSARDAERTAAHFAEDAVLHVAGMPPIRGPGAIQRFYANVFGYLSSSESDPEVLHVSESGDMAYGAGRVTNSFAGPEGPVEYTGKYLAVWEKRGDVWSIVRYGISSDQPDGSR